MGDSSIGFTKRSSRGWGNPLPFFAANILHGGIISPIISNTFNKIFKKHLTIFWDTLKMVMLPKGGARFGGKKMNETFKVLELTRLNNSYYGNPRYAAVIESSTGQESNAKTKTDAALGYMIQEGRTYIFDYHVTRTGNIILEKIVREIRGEE